jgi:ABC-2 type transport system permease protein
MRPDTVRPPGMLTEAALTGPGTMPAGPGFRPQSSRAGWSAARTAALIRHNTMLMLREPGPLISRLVLPLAFLVLLHPLYEQAQGTSRGVTQAVVATIVTFSLLAMSIAGGTILTERIWHTWERVRATAAHPAELLTGKTVPVLAALLLQQAIVIAFGAACLGLAVASLPLLLVVMLAWSLTLIAMGTALGLLAKSLSGLSACYDIGGMLLSSLGGALVPLTAMPGWIRAVAPASPGYWAVSALEAALRGDGSRTLAASAVLLAFAAGAGTVAAIRASRSWGRSAAL